MYYRWSSRYRNGNELNKIVNVFMFHKQKSVAENVKKMKFKIIT